MDTQLLQPTNENIMRCAAKLNGGGLVAFPTETVYALGAVATDSAAVKRLYDVKKRPSDNPLIVAVSKKSAIDGVAKNIPPKARVLIERFMPGALTLLLDKADCIPDIVTAGSSTVAVRIPNNPIALKLIDLVRKPVVVPSANTSSKPSPTLASHVADDLKGKIDYILDGGESEIGIESTIVDTRTEPPTVYRVGGVTLDKLKAAIGDVVVRRDGKKSIKYAPQADILFSAFYDNMSDNICRKYDELTARGRKTLILCLNCNKKKYGDRAVFTVGKDYSEYAHNLFARLRKADAERYDAVIAEGVEPKGIGESLVNRLIKISGGQII